MLGLNQLGSSETDLIFRDWGEAATLLEVVSQFNVVTGLLEETRFASELQVIRSEEHPRQQRDVSATMGMNELKLLVRKADLPTGIPLTSARIVVAEVAYEVCRVAESRLSGLLLLECIRSELSPT